MTSMIDNGDMRPPRERGGLLTRLKDIDAIKDRDKEILLASNKLASNKESYQDGKEHRKERYEKLREIKRREDNRNK